MVLVYIKKKKSRTIYERSNSETIYWEIKIANIVLKNKTVGTRPK